MKKDYTVTFEGEDAGIGYVVVTRKEQFCWRCKEIPI